MCNQQTTHNTTGHAMAFYASHPGKLREYDPTENGPEVEIIRSIRVAHALYTPGKEGELLRFQRFVDDAARAMYGKRYGRLGKKRQARVRKFVIFLHLEGKVPGQAPIGDVLEPWRRTNFGL